MTTVALLSPVVVRPPFWKPLHWCMHSTINNCTLLDARWTHDGFYWSRIIGQWLCIFVVTDRCALHSRVDGVARSTSIHEITQLASNYRKILQFSLFNVFVLLHFNSYFQHSNLWTWKKSHLQNLMNIFQNIHICAKSFYMYLEHWFYWLGRT